MPNTINGTIPPPRSRWATEQLIEELNEAIEQFERWSGYSPDRNDQERLGWFKADYQIYEQAMRRAIRAGLLQHPAVGPAIAAWISGRRSIGDREGLRSLKRGIEKDMLPATDEADLWIIVQSTNIERGLSLERVRRVLLQRVENDAISAALRRVIKRRLGTRQNLQRRLAAFGITVGR